ncbi:hypothetical protein [Streptosporangium saharense]
MPAVSHRHPATEDAMATVSTHRLLVQGGQTTEAPVAAGDLT